MAHLLPQLRCQFAEFLNGCYLKRLRILYQLTCGSFQVRCFFFSRKLVSSIQFIPYKKKVLVYSNSFIPKFLLPYLCVYQMLFQNILLNFMLSHPILLIILSFRLNLETDSLSHKLKARGPCKGRIRSSFQFIPTLSFSLFRYSCQHSHLGYLWKNA